METKTFILDAITRFTTLFKIHYNRKQAILLFIPYFWSNKCSLGEHMYTMKKVQSALTLFDLYKVFPV